MESTQIEKLRSKAVEEVTFLKPRVCILDVGAVWCYTIYFPKTSGVLKYDQDILRCNYRRAECSVRLLLHKLSVMKPRHFMITMFLVLGMFSSVTPKRCAES